MLEYHVNVIRDRTRVTRNVTTTRLFEDLDDWWYVQDGATAHTANITQDWLSDNVPNFIYARDWPGLIFTDCYLNNLSIIINQTCKFWYFVYVKR